MLNICENGRDIKNNLKTVQEYLKDVCKTKIHTFNAQEGDIAEVTISQANNYVFFNVIQDLNYSSALFVGMSELNPNHWEGILPKKGKYSVIVYQVGDAKDSGRIQRYTIKIVLKHKC